jgi:ACS family hexuronate transporter-like MFS transporter
MSATVAKAPSPARGAAWIWWVCVLLLLATMINYMDRLTLNLTAKRIKDELILNNEQYGQVEFAFGIAFALGALGLGWMVDRWNVRWIYPLSLFVWSAAGFATGFATGLVDLLLIRSVLGLAEAGNWPCALRTTQRILRPEDRTMGNGVLQSGAAFGAILIPGVVALLVGGPGTWRLPFFFVGAVGVVWVFLWLGSVRAADLALDHRGGAASPGAAQAERHGTLLAIYADPRFAVLVVTTVAINQTWHFLRVWLPMCLQEQYRYSEQSVFWFTTAYYVAAGVGSLASGAITLRLGRGRLGVHRSRVVMYAVFTLVTALTLVAAQLREPGPLLLGLLLLVGFGALGLYPVYYSLSQELTVRHQGKVTGVLGFSTWVASALMHPLVGRWLDRTHDWRAVLGLAGVFPVAGLLALLVLWRPVPSAAPAEASAGACGRQPATGTAG